MRKIILSLLVLISVLSFISADLISMGYISSDDSSVTILSGIGDNATTEEVPVFGFDDFLLCMIPIYPFPVNLGISASCLQKLIIAKN